MSAPAHTLAVQELAALQGVVPVEAFEDLLGDFWPDDENLDEFVDTVRSWRRESMDAANPA